MLSDTSDENAGKTLLTQQFLAAHFLDDLTARYGIAVKRHREFPNLVFLKYSQINSDMAEPIVQECRGLILDEAAGWKIASFPFKKFFNAHEGHAARIDWATAKVYEKIDGSMMTLYWYAAQWRVASNGLPDASGPVEGRAGTFADLFWHTWKALGYQLPEPPAPGKAPACYMFEMTTPFNRVVVPHASAGLTLIGARNLENCCELSPEPIASKMGWQCVRSFPLVCIDDCITAARELRAMEAEGYVVCDGDFNRVKVKSPQYVALAYMKDNFSARRMLEVVKANESAEFLAYFPEMTQLYEQVRAKWESVCARLESDYDRLSSIPSQKDFAAAAMKSVCSGALFARRAGKCKTIRGYFETCSQAACERVMLEGIESPEAAGGETEA